MGYDRDYWPGEQAPVTQALYFHGPQLPSAYFHGIELDLGIHLTVRIFRFGPYD
jgi:hypothetical protein